MRPDLRIVKMSGAGNDFIVVDARSVAGSDSAWIPRVCRRRMSVGADGVLLVEPVAADRIRVRYHNADGSEAFCGNGSRCAARYAHREGLAGRTMILETAIGEVPAEMTADGVLLTLPWPEDRGSHRVEVGERVYEGRHVIAGVPHFVIETDDLEQADLPRMGAAIRHDRSFGEDGTNVNLMQRDEVGRVRLRTYERGVEGETLACGSGAVAAAYVVRAGAPGGGPIEVLPASRAVLRVGFIDGTVRFEGDARIVFDGHLHEEA